MNSQAVKVTSIWLERTDTHSACARYHVIRQGEPGVPDYDIRIPLKTMGIRDSRATRITIGDARRPKSVVVSIAVQGYPR